MTFRYLSKNNAALKKTALYVRPRPPRWCSLMRYWNREKNSTNFAADLIASLTSGVAENCNQCLFYSSWLRGNSLPPFPLPLSSLPTPLEVCLSPSLEAGEGLGKRISSPNGSVSLSSVLWWILSIKLHHFGCLMNNNFLCLLPIKRMFSWYILIHCPAEKKIRAHNLAAVWGGRIVRFFGGDCPQRWLK